MEAVALRSFRVSRESALLPSSVLRSSLYNLAVKEGVTADEEEEEETEGGEERNPDERKK